MYQVMKYFGDVEPFLIENDDVSPGTRTKLLTFFSDLNKKILLQVELAAIIDWGKPFVKGTYKLEGDGPLALTCFEVIETITASIQSANYPNLCAVAERLSGAQPTNMQILLSHGQQCVQPAIDYFNGQLASTLQCPLAAFKAARFFSPQKMYDMQPNASCIDSLKLFPFYKTEEIERLKAELPLYLARASDVDTAINPLLWWKRNASDLPCWAAAAQKVLLVQPSSAASERVFSLLNASFNQQQDRCLQDYLEASIMLQYNDR